MDIYCLSCGEPWDLFHVNDNKDEFVFQEENTGKIVECPCCPKRQYNDDKLQPELSKKEKCKLDTLYEIADVLGDDIDGYASFVDDLEALGYFSEEEDEDIINVEEEEGD